MDLLSIASDPKQYSKGDASLWLTDKQHQENRSDIYWNVLKPILSQIKPKNVLDIGAGSAWVSQKLIEIGLINYEGIEPSLPGFNTARKKYPSLKIQNTSFENFSTASTYDAILAVMILSHINNIDEFFVKIKTLLNTDGACIIIIPEFYDDTRRFNRNGKEYDVQVLNKDEYVDRRRSSQHFALADIVRKPVLYIKSAENYGLILHSRLEFVDHGFSTKTLLVFRKISDL